MNKHFTINMLFTFASCFASTVFIFHGLSMTSMRESSTPTWIVIFGIATIVYGVCCFVLLMLAWLTGYYVIPKISNHISVIFLIVYFLVYYVHPFLIYRWTPGGRTWASSLVVAILSLLNWYTIRRITNYQESASEVKKFFTYMKKQFIIRYSLQAITFIVAIPLGLRMPFGFHTTFGHLVLPVPEAYWGTPHEHFVVWTVFVCCGFSAIMLPALFSTWLLIRGRGWLSRIPASFLFGLAIGAAWFMVITSPGLWSFILK